MNRRIRSIHSTQGLALVFYACALTLLVIPVVAFVPGAFGGIDQPHYTPDALTFPQIEVPGAMSTLALGINDRGQIVGNFTDAKGVRRGFLFDQGVYTPIDVPGATSTVVYGVNAHGQIAGFFVDARGMHGFCGTVRPGRKGGLKRSWAVGRQCQGSGEAK